MRRLLCGMILPSLAIAVSAPVALGAGAGTGGEVPIRVSPATGGIHTNFVLRFSIPAATGTTGSLSVSDDVTVSGHGHAGCVEQAEVPLRSAPADTAFKLTLNPSHLHGHWCTGRFNGMLMQRQTTSCPPGPVQQAIVCPLYAIAPRVLGRFHFTVTQPKKTHRAR
jgi:hypothetical protein